MRRFVCIGYFQGLLCTRFTNIESVEGSVKMDIKDIRSVKGTKVGGMSRRKYVGKTSWYLKLLSIFSEVSSVYLLRFSSILITRL